jgi:hypothetical protein
VAHSYHECIPSFSEHLSLLPVASKRLVIHAKLQTLLCLMVCSCGEGRNVRNWFIFLYLLFFAMYFNIFIIYFNVFQYIWKYLKVFESIWMYLNVFIVYLNVFDCRYSIFMIYFNVFIIYFNVFQCIWKYLSVLECI